MYTEGEWYELNNFLDNRKILNFMGGAWHSKF